MVTEVAAGSQTLDRALGALLRIGESGSRGLTLAECSASLGYSKPTVHRILRTLASRGFLRVDRERGLYTLGVANLRLGMAFLEQLDLRDEALPILRELGERTGETVHLGVLDGSDVVYIDKVESKHAVRMFSQIGRTMPAYSTGVGKAILAYLPDDELEQALPERLETRTAATITNRQELRKHLASVRRRGYSTDEVENEEGIRCVGAPVFDHTRNIVLAITAIGPSGSFDGAWDGTIARALRACAARVSARLGFSAG